MVVLKHLTDNFYLLNPILFFFPGGKKCHACSKRIYHETWKVTPELAEARWAHEQAKERELGEVIEFFGDLATPTES